MASWIHWMLFILSLTITVSQCARPACTTSFLNITITEGPVASLPLLALNLSYYCHDPDINDTLFYYFNNDTDGDLSLLFHIDPDSGSISWLKAPDAEEYVFTDIKYRGPFMMTVAVTDNSTSEPFVANILVEILPINDITPVINTTISGDITIPENVRPGPIDIACNASDDDLPGSGHEVTFVWIKEGDPDKYFSIDSKTCQLILNKPLDFEKNSTFTLTLEVYDVALNAPNSKSATMTITIKVEDVNDNVPSCSNYLLVVSEPESLTTSTTIASLNCTDVESVTTLNYTIVSQTDVRGRLNINDVGEITVNDTLDYENGDRTLSMVVHVTDQGPDKLLTATVTFVLIVQDVDDHVPVINPPYTATVSEKALLGDYVMTVNATDADSPDSVFSKITYELSPGCTPDWFEIDPVRGILFVKAAMDWRTSHNVTCPVKVSSNETDFNITTIFIGLIENNNNAPSFTQSVFQGSLAENETAGYQVVNVTATDLDSGDNGAIVYSMPFASPFQIDSNTGTVTLSKSGGIDYEKETSYLILVRATDKGKPPRTSETYVNIKVLPINESPPLFNVYSTQHVSEGAQPGTLVLKVVATDSDHGPDGSVTYRLVNNSVPFILDPTTGELRVGLGLDADITNLYNLIIEASDSSKTEVKSSNMTLTIMVDDVNDNPPVCPNILPQDLTNLNVTDVILTLKCTDPDASSSAITYTIVGPNPNSMFTLNLNDGVLKLNNKLSAGIFYLQVQASDNGSPPKTTTMTIEMKLDNTLKFKTFPTSPVAVNEMTNVSTSIANFTTEGSYEAPVFSIVGGNGSAMFSIDHLSGNVRIAKQLDRETISYYTLVVQAETASKLTATTTMSVSIEDYNDNVPAFANSFTARSFMENVTMPQVIGEFPAQDIDSGVNAKLTYFICSGNDDNVFQYDSSNGTLRATKLFDNMKTPAYNLVLCVKDGGTPSLNSSTIVLVKIESVDKFKPTITPSGGAVSLTLSESVTVGSRVLIINGSDPDRGSELNYTIYNESPPNRFFINLHTGEVYVIYPLDRETEPTLNFSVKVTNTKGESANTTVSVTLLDVNDNDPVFNPSSNHVFSTAYGTASNTKLGGFSVTDKDNGVNGSVVLSITSGNTDGKFKISGFDLLSNSLLGPNVLQKYELQVTATDKGSPARSSTAFVTVHIEPEFKQPSFTVNSSDPKILNETHPVGSLVAKVYATNLGATEGFAGDLIYSITSGDPNKNFFIEPYEGAIQLVSPLSYASKSFFSLLVLGQNRKKLSLNSTVLVNVTVLQVNLYTPQFTSEVYNWTVNETASSGSSIGKVSATDLDVGQFGKVSYSLKSGAPFQVNSSTGLITLAGALEYSQAKSYNFYVNAIDNAGATSKTSSAVVFIYVIDFNNHSPVFTSTSYSVSLPESFPLNQEFLITKANDLDSGSFGTVSYTITSGNSANLFFINTYSGSLSLSGSLNYDTAVKHVITVRAADGGSPSRSATASVTILVTDVNNHAPIFSTNRVDVNISTATAPLTNVHQVSARDDDVNINSRFFYAISGGNTQGLFSINTVTGQIKTTRAVTSDSGFYTLTIIAVDQGLPPLTGTTTVNILVKPVINSVSDYQIAENEPIGTIVSKQVLGANAPNYTIEGGNYLNSFSVSRTGYLSTNRVLDREDYGYYQLYMAKWNDSKMIDSYFTIYVEVVDKNDNSPVFSPSTMSIYVLEKTPAGTTVGHLTATDLDGPNNNVITYTISSQSSQAGQYFSVDSATGQITVKKPVDYETVSSMVMRVVATDNGTPKLSSTATVNVIVENFKETIIAHGFNTTYFISHEFPHDAASGDVVCSLIPEDFGLDSNVNRKNDTTSVGNNVFNVSRAGVVIVNLKDHIYENGRYFQWVVLTTTDPYNTTTLMGLVRLDTFNKDKHLVAVVVSLDEASLEAKKDALLADLQAKFPSPMKVKLWDIQSTTTVTNRRRLLATESSALIVVLADSATDSINNVDQSKTFLTQSEILAKLQSNKDGTPVSGLTSVPVSKVAPYTDVTTDSSMDTAMIVLIVFAVLAGIIIIAAIIAILVYCFIYRRKKDKEREILLTKDKKKEETFSKSAPILTSLGEEKNHTPIYSQVNDYNKITDQHTNLADHSVNSQKPVQKDKSPTRSEANIVKDSPPDPDDDGQPTQPVVATYIATTYSALDDPLSSTTSLDKLPVVEEEESHISHA
nr:protocadherin Fat 4-like [Biomphalaria glabrata]